MSLDLNAGVPSNGHLFRTLQSIITAQFLIDVLSPARVINQETTSISSASYSKKLDTLPIACSRKRAKDMQQSKQQPVFWKITIFWDGQMCSQIFRDGSGERSQNLIFSMSRQLVPPKRR